MNLPVHREPYGLLLYSCFSTDTIYLFFPFLTYLWLCQYLPYKIMHDDILHVAREMLDKITNLLATLSCKSRPELTN